MSKRANVYTDEMILMQYDSNKEMVIASWMSSSDNLDDEKYRHLMQEWLNTIEEHKPIRLLVNAREFYHTISIDTQPWMIEEIYPKAIRAGAQKIAFIESVELTSQISLDYINRNVHTSEEVKIKYFINEKNALNWLNSENQS